MKKYIHIILMIFCLVSNRAFGQDSFGNPMDIGGYSEYFNINRIYRNGTEEGTPDYRPSVYVKFTIGIPMDIIITNEKMFSGKIVILYAANGTSLGGLNVGATSFRKASLKPGAYILQTPDNSYTRIEGVAPTPIKNEFDVGIKSAPFSYTNTQRTEDYLNTFGRESNDVIYKFTLTTPMAITISHCGSYLSDTYVWLLSSLKDTVDKNDDYYGEGACGNPSHARIHKPNLAAGTYYVVSEGAYSNGGITTQIVGKDVEATNPEDPQTNVKLSHDRAYIFTRTVMSADNTKSINTVRYYDGLGRLSQANQIGYSGNGADLISLHEYDEAGREGNQWLGGAMDATYGAYVAPATIQAASRATNENDANPYSKTLYDSPLGRITAQYGAGAAWHTNNKAVITEYMVGATCGLYTTTNDRAAVSLTRSGDYEVGALYVTRITDEDGNVSYEFKDKLGQVVMTRQVNDSENLDTYYIYDIYGNVRAVLPPLAADAIASGTVSHDNSTLQKYAYLYLYDIHNRCIAKRLPGCDWVYYVYDGGDRVIFTQDGVQRTRSEWTFTIPDALGRTVITGTCTNSMNYAANPLGASVVKAIKGTAYKGYDVQGVALSAPSVLTVNYFDNYTFAAGIGVDYSFDGGGYIAQKAAPYNGLLTGKWVAQLDNTALGQYTVMYYDNLGRMVQSKAGNHLNGVEREYINYSFAGQPINRKHIHSGPTTQTEIYTYTYDDFGRLESTTHQLNGGAEVAISTNTYDKVGRLATTTKGGGLNLKQTIGYNVRSWVTSLTGSLYSQNNSYATYSGNISAMSWTVGDASQCNYAFTYDNLSRLRSATYTGDGQFGTSYSYDKHGNITALSRSGRNTTGSTYGPVDNLSFTYDGNQVTRITDGQKISFAESGDFRDYAAGAGANSYNANGALISDSHKGILGIGYNLLNLPREVAVKTSAVSGKVYYTYAADGTKLQTRHLNGLSMVPVMFGNTVSDALLPTKKTTDYVGNMVYENGSLKRILIDGGYIEGGVYNYYLKDHLGNNRVVLSSAGTVVQQTTYYPFGMAFATNTVAEQDKQPYKFGGKGLDRQNGLNMYDFSARQYEPAIGRFTTQDPLAEKYYSISPYAYCANNPLKFIDPTGKSPDKYTEDDTKQNLWKTFVKFLESFVNERSIADNKTQLYKDYADGNPQAISEVERRQTANSVFNVTKQITSDETNIFPFISVSIGKESSEISKTNISDWYGATITPSGVYGSIGADYTVGTSTSIFVGRSSPISISLTIGLGIGKQTGLLGSGMGIGAGANHVGTSISIGNNSGSLGTTTIGATLSTTRLWGTANVGYTVPILLFK